MSRFSLLVLMALFGVRIFGSDSVAPFSPFVAAVVVCGDGLEAAAAERVVRARAVFDSSALEAAVLEFPEGVLDVVFLVPVVLDAVLPFFSAITPLP
ncbi:MAG: hypothetical protein ABIE42_06980 [Candidatus Eisenbacteria bacterium]